MNLPPRLRDPETIGRVIALRRSEKGLAEIEKVLHISRPDVVAILRQHIPDEHDEIGRRFKVVGCAQEVAHV